MPARKPAKANDLVQVKHVVALAIKVERLHARVLQLEADRDRPSWIRRRIDRWREFWAKRPPMPADG